MKTQARHRGSGGGDSTEGGGGEGGTLEDGVDLNGGGAGRASDGIDDDEREELLARWAHRRSTDVSRFVANNNAYDLIDKFRPLFNVNTADVIRKLLYSIVPDVHSSRRLNSEDTGANRAEQPRYALTPDLYGPFVLTLTLAAILPMSVEGIKLDENNVGQSGKYFEQTILGTALFLSFLCWIGFTCVLKIGFLVSIKERSQRAASSWAMCAFVSGYGLFSHCLAMGANLLMGFLFYPVWILCVGASSISMAQQLSHRITALTNRSNGRQNEPKDWFIASAALLHFFMCLYVRNKVLGFSAAVLNVVNKIDGSKGGSHGSRFGNLDIATDDHGNVEIRPHGSPVR